MHGKRTPSSGAFSIAPIARNLAGRGLIWFSIPIFVGGLACLLGDHLLRDAIASHVPAGSARDELLRRANVIVSLGLAAIALDLIVLFLFLKTSLVSPLANFLRGARALARGGARSEQTVEDYGGLARAFSALEQEIRAADQTLEENNRSLESLVQQRTQELTRALAEADTAARVKSEFLANMSHEIRTPLNGILGMSELALETELSADTREYLEMVKQSSRALLSIVNDILDFSKIETNTFALNHEPFRFDAFIKSIHQTWETQANKKNLELVYFVSPRIPKYLVGDVHRLGQVFNSLLSNALKFTANRGGVVIFVDVEQETDEGVVLHYAVTDSGIGIRSDASKRIFDAFVQADSSSTRRFGGTGLGLAICRRLIEMMHGSIWVNSRLGIGSAFHFTARLGRADDDYELRSEQVYSIDKQLRGTELPRQLNILVAEDSVTNQKLILRLLEKRGAAVTLATNGQEALEQYQASTFDLILMDCQMPILNGIEATEIIRNLEKGSPRHIPIVALTAHALPGDRDRCLSAGMDNYLSKPIQVAQLDQILAQICATHPTATADRQD